MKLTILLQCDGKRPICGRCEKHGAECQYDVAQEGVTRMQNLQQQLESKSGEHSKLMNLFNAFQHGSDYEATTLLARLRLGANVDDLLSLVGSTQSSASGCVPRCLLLTKLLLRTDFHAVAIDGADVE